MRLFGRRRTTESAPRKPKPEPLPAAALARLAREREEARLAAERKRESAEEIERSCKALGFWWPGESVPEESRLSGRGWRAALVERLFGGGA